MCVIIAKPEGVAIPLETLTKCWTQNPDGSGICYVDSGRFVVHKSLDLLEFLDFEIPTEKNVLLHFRFATHGKIIPNNIHPFHVKGQMMVHNGVFRQYPKNAVKSDTCLYAEELRKRPYLDFSAIEQEIGSSKLGFLNKFGHFTLLGSGEWYENCWFSNLYWMFEINSYPQVGHYYAMEVGADWVPCVDYCAECGTLISRGTRAIRVCDIYGDAWVCSEECSASFCAWDADWTKEFSIGR